MATARLVSDSDVAAATSLAAEARRLGAEPAALAALERDFSRRARAETSSGGSPSSSRLRANACKTARCSRRRTTARSTTSRVCRPMRRSLPGSPRRGRSFGRRVCSPSKAPSRAANGRWPMPQLAGLAPAPGGAAAAAAARGRARGAAAATDLLGYGRSGERAGCCGAQCRSSIRDQRSLRGIEGWVDLEFVVDRNGQPRNLAVVQASPPGRFDAAALAAVAQYRYVPFERDGRVYERRLRLRVRFQVQ